MLKRWLHWFHRQMRLSSPALVDEWELLVAAVEGAGVLPLETVVGLSECSLVLSWAEDILAAGGYARLGSFGAREVGSWHLIGQGWALDWARLGFAGLIGLS